MTALLSVNTSSICWSSKPSLIELKTVQALDSGHRAQCLNYLRATGMHLCLLMNFGAARLEIRRIVLNL